MQQSKILSPEEFNDVWANKLNSKQKKARINRAYLIIRETAKKQIEILKKYEKSSSEKNIGFHYFFNIVMETWRQADFAVHLGKSKNKKFSFYPVRTVFENMLRLGHYVRQKRQNQDEIVIREFLRVIKRFYEFAKASGQNISKMEKSYENFAKLGNYPNIEQAKINDDPFPSIKDLAYDYFGEKGLTWYFFYQYLAESNHGKLPSIVISGINEESEHLRVLMIMLLFCQELLKITDIHMAKFTEKEVSEAIINAEAIIKKPIK